MLFNLKILTILIIFFLISLMLTPWIINKFQIDSLNEPTFKSYRSDEMSFLKTFYLMKKEENFYQAFQQARENFVDGNNLSKDTFTWRTPTIFYFWSLVTQSGSQILTLFIFLCLLSLLASYLISRKIIGSIAGIFSVIFLLFYLLDSLAYKTSFLFTEWWGLFFYLFGLTFFLYNHKNIAIIFFVLAVISRELFVAPLILNFLISLFRKNKLDRLTFGLPILGFGVFYLFHQNNITHQLNTNTASFTFWQRFHFFDWAIFQRLISFSMKSFVFSAAKTHYLFFLMGLVGLFWAYFYYRVKLLLPILITVVTFLLLLPFVAVYDNDYWGIFFMPFVLISIPFLLLPVTENK